MNTKIFCDIAELDLIKKFNKKKIVKGFTTNPSLMRKAGAKDYKSYSKKILEICNNKPVSLEVFADEYKEMKIQALNINTWGKNVYVKIPVANSKGKFMGRIIKELNNYNIKLNITAVYNAEQTKKILKLINKKTKVIISIFAGRAGDTGKDPLPEFIKSIKLAKKYKNKEYLQTYKRYATHPHQLHHEMLSETGLFGYLSFLIFFLSSIALAINSYLKIGNIYQLSGLIYVITSLMPILPSGSFLSTFSGGIFWLNFAIMCAYIRKIKF